MRIVKLDATDSTNSHLRRMSRNQNLTENTLVWALEQTKARGQMGTTWYSDRGENLTFSVFRKIDRVKNGEQFYITMATSLAIYEVLEKLKVQNVRVKWPNDILAGKQKICGILIESVIKKGVLEAVIIGVGLNVNQMNWDDIPHVTSIKRETGIHFALEDILHQMVSQFHSYVQRLLEDDLESIKDEYESRLFRKGKATTFERQDGSRFVGIIAGVSAMGKLQLILEDNVKEEFDLKEISLLY